MNIVIQHSALLRKLDLNVEDFYVKKKQKKKTMGLKNHVFECETRKSGLFLCYRLKINDSLSSYKQNLKIDIFTPLQQILATAKVGLAHYDSFRGGGSQMAFIKSSSSSNNNNNNNKTE